MSLPKQLSIAVLALLLGFSVNAQIEAVHLFSKGYSGNGFGAFLHVGVPVSKAAEVTGEAGFDYISNNDLHVGMVPLLLGYRHTLDGSGTGWYVEPAAGYNAGSTDIQKQDANGNWLYNSYGKELDRKVSGPMAGLSLGYIIPKARLPLNIGLRFQHVFVSGGDPSASLLSLRVSWSLSAGKKLSGAGGK